MNFRKATSANLVAISCLFVFACGSDSTTSTLDDAVSASELQLPPGVTENQLQGYAANVVSRSNSDGALYDFSIMNLQSQAVSGGNIRIYWIHNDPTLKGGSPVAVVSPSGEIVSITYSR